MAIIAGLACVDGVFLEESLEQKAEYLRGYSADILVMGDDWAGKFDSFAYICEVVYFPRTPSVSTTGIIEVIRGLYKVLKQRCIFLAGCGVNALSGLQDVIDP